LSYAQDIWPIFEVRCTGCHPGTAGQFAITSDVASVESQVSAGNPAGSNLFQRVSSPNNSMPPGWASEPGPLPQVQIDLIEAWIQGGALP
jgi:hypothetical protein